MGTGRCPEGVGMKPLIMVLIVIALFCTVFMYLCLAAISSKYSKYEEAEDQAMAAEHCTGLRSAVKKCFDLSCGLCLSSYE